MKKLLMAVVVLSGASVFAADQQVENKKAVEKFTVSVTLEDIKAFKINRFGKSGERARLDVDVDNVVHHLRTCQFDLKKDGDRLLELAQMALLARKNAQERCKIKIEKLQALVNQSTEIEVDGSQQEGSGTEGSTNQKSN